MNLLGLLEVRRPRPIDASPAPSSPPAVTAELIELADRLAVMSAESRPLDPGWIRERLHAILALCEVAPILDEGAVDFARHEIVADRSTACADEADHIAETVRPGYLWRGSVLRPQRVVAWVADEADADSN